MTLLERTIHSDPVSLPHFPMKANDRVTGNIETLSFEPPSGGYPGKLKAEIDTSEYVLNGKLKPNDIYPFWLSHAELAAAAVQLELRPTDEICIVFTGMSGRRYNYKVGVAERESGCLPYRNLQAEYEQGTATPVAPATRTVDQTPTQGPDTPATDKLFVDDILF